MAEGDIVRRAFVPTAKWYAREYPEVKAVQADERFFREHKDRRYRIRLPLGDEKVEEFQTLGPHAEARRRIIAIRAKGVIARQYGIAVMRIPFLLFADETVEDRDDVLGPIVNEVMRVAAREYGLGA